MRKAIKREIYRLIRIVNGDDPFKFLAPHRLAESVRLELGLDEQLAAERILENPYVTAKRLSPLEADKGFFVIPFEHRVPGTDLPVPPKQFWEGYGATEEAYLASGREHVNAMLDILRNDGASPEDFLRVLDFGCAAGRMLRFFPRNDERQERWGSDLKAEPITWCQGNLSPKMLFLANTTFPHLPFEDNYFDLVYAGSVFTHIGDLPDAWFLELLRILRKGGYAYITINDKSVLKLLFTKYASWKHEDWFREMLRNFDRETGALSQDFACFSFEGGKWGGFPVPQVFYDIDYLVRKWSPVASVRSVNPEAFGYQTAVLFQK